MTIHSDWSRLFYSECPRAFTPLPNLQRPEVGIIDGHLQLMCLHHGLPSWDAFLRYLFLKPIMQLYEAGCPRVVLCFDAYENVPIYKSMTQIKRTQAKPVATFYPHQDLPAEVPTEPMLYLMNRHFKLKLVDMICKRLPPLLFASLPPSSLPPRQFILDYKRVLVFTEGQDCAFAPSLDGVAPMGESDVKFCRYVTKYGNALVHAIDGDYLAIALLYYTLYPPTITNEIHIYRQLSSFSPTPKTKNRKPHKCWVNVPLLRDMLLHATHSICRVSSTDAQVIHSIVFLMLLAGTDFSRPLPWLGPRRLWDHLSNVLPSLLDSVDLPLSCMISTMSDKVVAKLYALVFAKHASGVSLSQVLDSFSDSSLSLSVKTKFPSLHQVTTTLANVAWVIEYWMTHNASPHTPLDGTCGYIRCPQTRRIVFSDQLPS